MCSTHTYLCVVHKRIGVWFTHVLVMVHTRILIWSNFPCMLDFRIVIEVFSFLSVFDKWKFGCCSYCRLKVIDCLQSWETRRVCVCVCVCVGWLFCSLWSYCGLLLQMVANFLWPFMGRRSLVRWMFGGFNVCCLGRSSVKESLIAVLIGLRLCTPLFNPRHCAEGTWAQIFLTTKSLC